MKTLPRSIAIFCLSVLLAVNIYSHHGLRKLLQASLKREGRALDAFYSLHSSFTNVATQCKIAQEGWRKCMEYCAERVNMLNTWTNVDLHTHGTGDGTKQTDIYTGDRLPSLYDNGKATPK